VIRVYQSRLGFDASADASSFLPASRRFPSRASSSRLRGRSSGAEALEKFVRFADCEFIETPYADVDSFRVRVDRQERVLRLYFVDAPESDTRFPDRNAEVALFS